MAKKSRGRLGPLITEEDFSQFVEDVGSLMRGVIHKKSLYCPEADCDAAFTAAIKKCRRMFAKDGCPRNPWGYMVAVAKNCAIDELRRCMRYKKKHPWANVREAEMAYHRSREAIPQEAFERMIDELDGVPDVEESCIDAVGRGEKKLREALLKWLPRRIAQCFFLRRCVGLKVAQVAKMMGIDTRTVSDYTYEAMQTLKADPDLLNWATHALEMRRHISTIPEGQGIAPRKRWLKAHGKKDENNQPKAPRF